VVSDVPKEHNTFKMYGPSDSASYPRRMETVGVVATLPQILPFRVPCEKTKMYL
jgi:hypothetical protein